MKKIIMFLVIIGAFCGIYVCGNNLLNVPNSSNTSTLNFVQNVSEGNIENSNENSSENGTLSLLTNNKKVKDGYYYLAQETKELPNGKTFSHLMYIDFKTGKEIYLCNNSACNHYTENCSSVFLNEEFKRASLLFVFNDKIYILSKDQDRDGVSVATMGISKELSSKKTSSAESSITSLYSINLDGTGREKIYTFDSLQTIEDFVVGDNKGLYFITKKLTTQSDNGYSYQTSSERNLVFLDLNTKKEKTLFKMDFDDEISWKVIGTSNRKLVLYGVDFGQKVSTIDKKENSDLYKSSYDVFATLDIDTGKINEIYRIFAPLSRSYVADENNLYFSKDGDKKIIKIDLNTGKNIVFANINQNCIWEIIGDKLLCREFALKDKSSYFIDLNTGDISSSNLKNKTTGSVLQIIAESENEVLVLYNCDATYRSDGSFTVNKNYYGLIKKEDLYSGKENYRTVEMIKDGGF